MEREHERRRCLPSRKCRPADGGDERRSAPGPAAASAGAVDAPGRRRPRRAGPGVPALLHRSRASIRSTRSSGSCARRVIGNERGEVVFEQRDVEIPEVLVAAGHQHRRLEVFPRPDRHARARAQRQAADRPRRRHHHRLGAREQVLRERRGSAGVQRRPEAHPGLSEGGVQQPGLVQLRLREGAAVLGLLHQLGRRTRWTRS